MSSYVVIILLYMILKRSLIYIQTNNNMEPDA